MSPKKTGFTKISKTLDEDSIQFNTADGRSGTLRLVVTTEKFLDFVGLRRLNVDIRVLLDPKIEQDGEPGKKKMKIAKRAARTSKSKEEHAGHILAWHIRKERQAVNGKGMAWVQEVLAGRSHPDEDVLLQETRAILGKLYTKRGKPRAVCRAFEDVLDAPLAILIDGFVLEKNWRGVGFGRIVVPLFHNMIRTTFIGAKQGQQDRAIMILSPAADTDTQRDKGKDSDVTVERKLIRSYFASGYRILMKGDEEVEGSMTLMWQELR